MALHSKLQHLDTSGTYARILFCGLQLCLQYYRPGSATGQASPECLTPSAGGSQTSCLTGGSTSGWENISLTPGPSAPVPLKAAFFPLFSSPCTPTAAPPVTSPSNSLSSRTPPHSLGSSLGGMSPLTGGRLTIWGPGVGRTTA